jgi:TPR repeat protein
MDRAIERVGEQVVNALGGERRLRLAVSDLLDQQGVTTALGRYVAERLTTRLATGASFSVIGRRRVEQVLDELGLGAYDLMQAADARLFGRMIGADAIVVGTLSVLPQRVDVDVRIVDVEGSRILGAAQATMGRTGVVSSMLEPVRSSTAQMRERAAGSPQSDTLAVEQYRRDCEDGRMLSCSNLGVMYFNGSGVAQSETRAVELYRRACDGGNLLGCSNLGTMYMDGHGVARNDARAVELYRRACDGGNALGCSNLGSMYMDGLGVARNDARAVELFRRACDGGQMLGCGKLGDMYADGRGVAQSATRAAELYQRACNGGLPEACNLLRSASPGVRP